MADDFLFNPQKPHAFGGGAVDRYNFLTFAAMVAGKSAMPTAKKHAELIRRFPRLGYPGRSASPLSKKEIDRALRAVRVGKYTLLTKFFWNLHHELRASPMFLYSNDRELIGSLPGIGLKSASFYIMYTSPSAQLACLDVHILKFLRQGGISIPEKATPQSFNRYRELELAFLARARAFHVRPWVLDMYLWTAYNNNREIGGADLAAFVNDMLTQPEYAAYVRP